MKKIKTIGAISFALIGGGSLVGVPLSATSCSSGGELNFNITTFHVGAVTPVIVKKKFYYSNVSRGI